MITHIVLWMELMISLTTYWQEFRDCLDAITSDNPSEIYLQQIDVAKRLIATGLTIEKAGLTEIKAVGNVLATIAEGFNHEVFISIPPKVYSFYLPKISDLNSLILASVYFQHLNNYQRVEYQGTISFFRGTVEKGVQEKKERLKIQAAAMLNEIRNYCHKNSLNLDETGLLKQDNERPADYIARVTKSFSPVKKPEEIKAPIEHPLQTETKDEFQQLQDCLEVLEKKETELQGKIDQLAKRLMDYRQSTQQYVELNKQWSGKSWFSKLMIWIASMFRTDTLIQQMAQAQEKHDQAARTLNNEFTPYKSADDYQTALKIQLHATATDYEDTKQQLEKLNLERIKSDMLKQVASQVPAPSTTEVSSELVVRSASSVRKQASLQQSTQFSLFKYAPSSDTLIATAVAGVAIAYEHYIRQTC